jgi:hypothetical protein
MVVGPASAVACDGGMKSRRDVWAHRKELFLQELKKMHVKWRGLELPSAVHPDLHTLSPTYGKFVAEPFERGFGTTVGNSLRRVLLSSLEGSAVTQIKDSRCAARIHHSPWSVGGCDRYRAQRQIAGGQES